MIVRVVRYQPDLLVEQPGEVDHLRLELELPAVRLRGGEEALDETCKAPALVVDDLQVAAERARIGIPLQDQARVPEDARERRPQLVRDDRDQLGLRPLALAQLLVLDLERATTLLDGLRHRVEGPRQLSDLGRTVRGNPDREVA